MIFILKLLKVLNELILSCRGTYPLLGEFHLTNYNYERQIYKSK
jgi:hypothetical protein